MRFFNSNNKFQEGRITSKVSLFFYDRPKFSVTLWLLILVAGIASYTTLLKREGFPTISVPYSFVSGSYLVNDPSKVDAEIGAPVSEIISEMDNVKFTDTHSGSNYFNIIVQYDEGTDATKASATVEKTVRAAGILPKQADVKFEPLAIGVNERGDDMLVAFYATKSTPSTQELYDSATSFAKNLKDTGKITQAQRIEAIDPFARGIDPETGEAAISQKTFDRFGLHVENENQFHDSVEIGIKGVKGFDVLTLDEQVQQALDEVEGSGKLAGFDAQISYSLAPSINDQISGLQKSLTEGLIAILIVSGLIIALRASLITVGAMVTVILATLALLFAIGYTLNTITLFSLILCLSLIVDDTIIMVEAIDAERRRNKKARDTIKKAATKISRVMVAATLTASLAFVPLIFVGGILGSFIRAIPVTVILSLLISLFVALAFIPILSRLLLLRPKQLGHGDKGSHESAAHHLERFIASSLCRPILWMNHNRKRQIGLGLTAVIFGMVFILGGGSLFSKVGFNIFAASKDSDQIGVHATFVGAGSIEQAQAIAREADKIVADDLGVNFEQASYFNTGTIQSATLTTNLISFNDRSISAPDLSEKIEKNLNEKIEGAEFKVSQIDVGPPVTAFTVRIQTDNQKAANNLAQDVSAYLSGVELKRPDGTTARFKSVTVSNPDDIPRRDANRYISVSGEFDGEDTSTLVLLAEDAVKKEFNNEKLSNYGLKSSNIYFDIGQEEENQESFKTLLIAFPLVLVAIYLLLSIQFRSLLQPILIFMAIPFSLFGITTGLWLTDNPFSFFTMLGFFALIGLSIKNTILLTDYANQARRKGRNSIEAVSISLQERFRPLIATSLTAVVSLIPLYLSNPFWEGLTVTLMFGLLSSTFLVITVFPYYYLGAEYIRLRISRKTFGLWLLSVAPVCILLGFIDQAKLIPLAFIIATIGFILVKRFKKL